MKYILSSGIQEKTFIIIKYSYSITFINLFRYVIEMPIFNCISLPDQVECYHFESPIKIVREKIPIDFRYGDMCVIMD